MNHLSKQTLWLVAALVLVVLAACGGKVATQDIEPEPVAAPAPALELETTPVEPEPAPVEIETALEPEPDPVPMEIVVPEPPPVATPEPEPQKPARARKPKPIVMPEPVIEEPVMVPAEPSPNVDDVVAKLVKNLKWGRISLDAPVAIMRDETDEATLTLDVTATHEQLREIVQREAVEQNLDVYVNLQVKATLESNGFTLRSQSPERQGVVSSRPLRWNWSMEPRATGPQTLAAALTFDLFVNGENRASETIRQLTHDVQVNEPVVKQPEPPAQAPSIPFWVVIIALLAVAALIVFGVRKFTQHRN